MKLSLRMQEQALHQFNVAPVQICDDFDTEDVEIRV
jgi:hypothetical protein